MAAERPSRKKPAVHRGRVQRTEQLTPHMVRVVLGGEGMAEFTAGEYSDHYVKLVFPRPGVSYPEPFDIAQIRAEFPRDQWPSTRTYTIRAWDPATRELTVDFVVHGDEGLAGPWAAAAQPGEEIFLLGPGGAYAPEATADWHLLAGDESALAGHRGLPRPDARGHPRARLHRGGRAGGAPGAGRTGSTPRSAGCTAAPPR